jgi:hypothetical protein
MLVFCDHMKAAMCRKGWKPVRLASELADGGAPVAVVTVEAWLRGDNQPSLKNALLVAELLEFRLEDTNRTVDGTAPASTEE